MCYRGWFKWWRYLTHEPVLRDRYSLQVFVWLLTRANTETKQAKHMQVPVGSTLISRRKAAETLDMSESEFRSAIARLESAQLLTHKSTKHGTLITICEYETYGNQNSDLRPQSAQDAPSLRPDLRSKKKEVNTQTSRVPRSAFVRPTVEDVQAAIDELQYDIDAEAFVSFYESNGWKVGKSPMKSWRAALVTWQKRRDDEDRNGSRFRKPVQRVKTRAEIEAEEEAPFVWPALPE